MSTYHEPIKDLSTLFVETDRIISKIHGMENFSSQLNPQLEERDCQNIFQGKSSGTSDLSPHNPLGITPSQNVAHLSIDSLMTNSRPDHTVELSDIMPRQMGDNFEHTREATCGTTNEFQGYQEEYQLGENFGIEFKNTWETHQETPLASSPILPVDSFPVIIPPCPQPWEFAPKPPCENLELWEPTKGPQINSTDLNLGLVPHLSREENFI